MVLGRYRLLAQLGAGADGVSYRARVEGDHSLSESLVEVRDLTAAKVDAGRWKRLIARIWLASRLDDPTAIRVIDSALDHDPPYVMLDWVDGRTLAEVVSGSRPMPQDEAVELVAALSLALDQAHRMGLAHGRLGPGRIFLVGGRPRLDFTGLETGHPAIRSLDESCRDPQAGEGPAAERAADLCGLGGIVVWLLTGGTGPADRERAMANPVLGTVIRDLLADDPADRPTAIEIHERLTVSRSMAAEPVWTDDPSSHDLTGDWRLESSNLQLGFSSHGSSAPGIESEPSLPAAPPSEIGRYRLLEKLGEGGQGVVFRAFDPAQGTTVAIKILRSERADASGLKRFRKEARMLAAINSPHVVNLLEFNEEDGVPYLVLEYISGEGLDRLLRRRSWIDEREALAIMASVARGLSEAHERGIVHRDIKPSNIFILQPSPTAEPLSETLRVEPWVGMDETMVLPPTQVAFPRSAELDGSGGSGPRIKISDFGLARHIVDSESMALTAAGALLGTPHYMAPEQWTGRVADARSDVYAMGVTLYQLLAGKPPFEGTSHEELANQHCHAPPPPLSAENPMVGDGVARVVERAMAKRPEDRYVDAGAMLRDLEALLHGSPIGMPMHPVLPNRDSSRVLAFEFSWELDSSPRELWPLVTNTDRLDRAIGFPAVKYTTRHEEGRGARTFSETRKAGMLEQGEEHPYEWVEPRRMGVFREYSQGPFVWLVSTVDLAPRPGGGTSLVHRLHLEPRTWAIRVGSRFGVGVGLRKSLEKVYRRIDATIQGRARGGSSSAQALVDPFEAPAPLPAPKRKRLESLLDTLAGRGVDAALVERLGEFLAAGSAQEVARIRPIALARRLELDPDQVIAACLHGAREGLLELRWDLLCPVCRISCQVGDSLKVITEHAHCKACDVDFPLDFASSIEMIFRVHPEIREADLAVYCIGGPAHSPHVPAQVRLAPGERMELELELSEGAYRLRGPRLPWSVEFAIRGGSGARRWEVELAPGSAPTAPASMPIGGQVLVLGNRFDQDLVVRVERTASRSDALTAARAASIALFRELFPDQLLAPGQLAAVSMVTLVVTALDPARADAIYREQGDTRAFGMIRESLRVQSDAIKTGGGAVVRIQGEGLVASFSDPTAAVRSALGLLEWRDTNPSAYVLMPRIGIHRGPVLAATVNDQLEYFGATARRAAATLEHAGAGDLILTQQVASVPDVAALIADHRIRTEVVGNDGDPNGHVIRARRAIE